MTVISLLLLAAAGANALLAGASLDQSIKQLLARHRMGADADLGSRGGTAVPGVHRTATSPSTARR